MAKKLSNLFFSTAKNLMRLQRTAFRLATPLPIPRKKKATKKIIAKKVLAKLPTDFGTGAWRKQIYHHQPPGSELLGEMVFYTYTPAMRPVSGMPLVVVLHGCQQTAADIAMGAGMNQLADQKGYVVLYPQQTTRANHQRCWRWFKPDAAHGLAEADGIAELIRATVTRHRLDRNRVYIAGLSAGAAMAGMVALRHPTLIAALAMHSGPVLGDAHNSGAALMTMHHGTTKDPVALLNPLMSKTTHFTNMPAIILQGQKDKVVAATNAQQLLQQFTYLNDMAGQQTTATTKAREPIVKTTLMGKDTVREYTRSDVIIDGRIMVRLCVIDKLGHAWSGGNAAVKFHSTTGPRASLLMWQFFSRHKRH